jgi:thiamine biosynthesis lipoprotein
MFCGKILLVGLLFSEVPLRGEETLRKFHVEQIRMGVPFNLTFYAADEAAANNVSQRALSRIRQLDRLLSDYDPDSELMQLCAQPPGTPVAVSSELATVMEQSLEFSRRTGGAFDVSVGPLVKLWRAARRKKALPATEQLALALASVDYRAIELDREQRTITLRKPGMQLDLGALAKGYAADEALRIFCEHGITRVLVDAGGDLVVGDPPPGQDYWRVAVEALRDRSDPEAASLLQLRNCAVATSGDAYQFVEIDGIRYSHIVDVRTGLGLTTRSSVTVVAPTGMLADGWATAICVLGPERGIELLEQQSGCAARVAVVRSSNDLSGADPARVDAVEIVTSTNFRRYLSPAVGPADQSEE